MKFKQILFTVAISAVTAFGIIWAYSNFVKKDTLYGGQQKGLMPANYKYAGFQDSGGTIPGAVDFTQSASAAIPTVVHIKTKTNAKQLTNSLPRTQQPKNPFSDFFDDDLLNQMFGGRGNVVPEQRASGSGVIIGDNGFIVTNNHVVANADEITVTLSNKKVYKAKVVGTDPAYDLAVIKIDATALPYLVYGNSEDVKVGQWVLAIGYPLNLETTVTAGIISAKARSLGLNRDKSGSAGGAVESYLQTDAAVNMGNSGGALINTDGKLIGVNSAIASPTGYYSGYSYAIPVNIVKKVVDDIIKFGTVQRGYLGINYLPASDMSEDDKKREGIPLTAYGIYVRDVPTTGGAYDAGIRKGDIIKSIAGVMVESGAEVQEQVSRYKPGDKVPITYIRNDKESTTNVTLKNSSGNFDIVKNEITAGSILGADLANLDAKKAKDFGIAGGVIVKKINDAGILGQQTRMKDSFIILKVNDKTVNNISELKDAIATSRDITISGFYPGYEGMYDYQLSLDSEKN